MMGRCCAAGSPFSKGCGATTVSDLRLDFILNSFILHYLQWGSIN